MSPIRELSNFGNSKVASRKVLSDNTGNLNIDRPGNKSKMSSTKSSSKAAINPTSDKDDGNSRTKGLKEGYSNAGGNSGGASGDGATPGYGNGPSSGNHSLNGSHGNVSKRRPSY